MARGSAVRLEPVGQRGHDPSGHLHQGPHRQRQPQSPTPDRVVRVPGLVVAHRRDHGAAAQVADHLRSFWTPRMRDELVKSYGEGSSSLDPVSKAAVEILRALKT